MKRLSEATLALATGAEVPRYDRTPPPSIVHLGVDLGNITTKASLADAFVLALTKIGRTNASRGQTSALTSNAAMNMASGASVAGPGSFASPMSGRA